MLGDEARSASCHTVSANSRPSITCVDVVHHVLSVLPSHASQHLFQEHEGLPRAAVRPADLAPAEGQDQVLEERANGGLGVEPLPQLER